MRINGTLLTTFFKGWVRVPDAEGDGKVFSIHAEPRALFEKAQWDTQKGKISLGDVYHTVDSLLEIEECLTCNKLRIAFPDELDQVVTALKAYKGKRDITPLPHPEWNQDNGFHVR